MQQPDSADTSSLVLMVKMKLSLFKEKMAELEKNLRYDSNRVWNMTCSVVEWPGASAGRADMHPAHMDYPRKALIFFSEKLPVSKGDRAGCWAKGYNSTKSLQGFFIRLLLLIGLLQSDKRWTEKESLNRDFGKPRQCT